MFSSRASSITIITRSGRRDVFAREHARELAVRLQLARFEQRPHLAREFRLQQLRREAAQRAADVVHVALEHREAPPLLPAAFTACGRSMITGPSGVDQHVELRQVAVDQADAQHAHDLAG